LNGTHERALVDFTESSKGFAFPWTQFVVESSRPSKKLYFEKFEIAPIVATLSFASSPSYASIDYMPQHFHPYPPIRATSVASVRQFLHAASKTLTKIHNAPLHWRALRWTHVFVPRETMLHQMSMHYQHEALRQAYLLLGSVDVLGNPIKVWHTVKGGLHSFVSEPLRGLYERRLGGFLWGCVRGSTLLLRSLVYAQLDFCTRIASSVNLGLTEVCSHIDSYTGLSLAQTVLEGMVQSVLGIVVHLTIYIYTCVWVCA
jgi:hypothetical protein